MALSHRFLKSNCLLLFCALTVGCDKDRRLVEQAQQRQAEQNREMARLHQQVAEGSKRLVDADAQSRRDFMQAQQNIDRQREAIVAEQRELADQRQRDPMVAAALTSLAILLACLAPLALAFFALQATSRREPDDGLAELLVMELAANESTFGDHSYSPLAGPATPRSAALPPRKTGT